MDFVRFLQVCILTSLLLFAPPLSFLHPSFSSLTGPLHPTDSSPSAVLFCVCTHACVCVRVCVYI